MAGSMALEGGQEGVLQTQHMPRLVRGHGPWSRDTGRFTQICGRSQPSWGGLSAALGEAVGWLPGLLPGHGACRCSCAHEGPRHLVGRCGQDQSSRMVEKEGAFNQSAGKLGRWWAQQPPKPPPKTRLGLESF